MAEYSTDWEEYPTGQQPSDWTKTGVANRTYEVVDIGGAHGKVLRVTNQDTVDGNSFFRWDTPTDAQDWETLILMRYSDPAQYDQAGNYDNAYLVRWIDDQNHYRSSYLHTTSTGDQADYKRVGKRVADVYTRIASENITDVYLDIYQGAWFWIRTRVNGDDLEMRLWLDGDPEPSLPDAQQTDTDHSGQTGGVGLSHYVPKEYEVAWFSAADGGATAPSPPSLTLTPDGDGTVSGFEDEAAATTGLFDSIDEGVSGADGDTTYIRNVGAANASAYFGLTATPSDLASMDSLDLRIRLRKE